MIKMNTQTEQIRELISSVALVGFAIAVGMLASQLPEMPDGSPGPALFPSIIAVGIGLTGLFLGIQLLWKNPEQSDASSGDVKGLARLGAGMMLAFFAPWLAPYIGFVPVVGIVVFGLGLLMHVSIKWAIAGGILTSLLVFVIFNWLLGVSL